MELIDSVPITDINSENVKLEMFKSGNFYDDDTVKFKITDVKLTESDSSGNQLITKLARKKWVNVTISGYIDECFKVYEPSVAEVFFDYDMNQSPGSVNLQGTPINITFYGVRVIRENGFDENLQTRVTVPKLMIDNIHEFYGFLKPLYVEKGVMSAESEQNIYLSYMELAELLKDSTVNLGVIDVSKKSAMTYRWITECKKGDNNGD